MDTMPAYVPKRFATYEEYLAYKREVNRRYSKTAKGRANTARQNASPSAKGRYERYRQTEKYREAQRRYRESPKAKATQLATLRRLRAEHPEKNAARQAIAVAIRQGLQRPDLCSCGSAKRIEAHHHKGYAEKHWLDVQWLCSKCHKAAHH